MATYKIVSESAEETEELGRTIAASLRGGEIIELSSDLGGGKTTFTRGLARGLGIREDITSPTFVVSKVYHGSSLELHHYDFYRLGELGIMSEEIQEVIGGKDNVTVIEWSGSAHKLLPKDRTIHIEIVPMQKETSREIVCTTPQSVEVDFMGIEVVEC